MRVHVVQVGCVPVSEQFFAATRFVDALRALTRRGESFPVFAFIIEHSDGHIVVDTGYHHRIMQLPIVRLLCRLFRIGTFVTPDGEVGPRMCAIGLRPEDVRLVIPTHLDADHAGGISHFPNAMILVNRAEYNYATQNGFGRLRTLPQLWPDWFQPSLYDLEPEPYGPFPQSFSATEYGDVRIVPTPGHSPAHVSPVIDSNGKKLLFVGDHVLRQNWITVEGIRLAATLHVYKRQAQETSERICAFVKDQPTVVLPSHDPDIARIVTTMEPIQLSPSAKNTYCGHTI
jgi:glyoxylase-like metal-dependent hydrolase (beta-lactamase superfamily II)